MAKKDVKTNLFNHSEAKVRLLGEYLKRYVNIISNDGYTKKIHIHDLFCGEGLYENGGEGSPLVIMREIKDLYFKNVSGNPNLPKINCFFNDIDNRKVLNVEKAIADKSLHYLQFGELNFTSEDYKDLLNELANKVAKLYNEKAFIFIDPYEYKHIKISHIRELLKGKKSEVLLWLPTQFMYRFESNGTPTALKDFIEEIVPFKDWTNSESVWKFVGQLKEGFQKGVGLEYFVDNFTIEKDKNTVFCLFFFTPHIKGFEKMLEAKWEIDSEYGKGWTYTDNTPSLFYEQKTNPLEEKIKVYLSNKCPTNAELFEFTLRQGFLPKHTNEILFNWQANGKIDVKLEDGSSARKKSFYLNYDNYKKAPKKVTFSIK